ncbi:DNA-formamidopyrimidine glycosylase, partial [Vibrio parahaemolyticus]
YANESLFKSRILPTRQAGQVTPQEWVLLVENIKATLKIAINQGGTTLKDFAQADGKPGYFAQELLVYGKAGEPCPECGEPLQDLKIGQRNTFFCNECQQ